jgi:predicted RNA binding protein YcfA (HicA-like mRNA interferase family)
VSSSLPVVQARQLVRVATRLDFVLDRQRGSHAIYIRESDGRRIVIPMHRGRDIRVGLLRQILTDMGITPDEFRELL